MTENHHLGQKFRYAIKSGIAGIPVRREKLGILPERGCQCSHGRQRLRQNPLIFHAAYYHSRYARYVIHHQR